MRRNVLRRTNRGHGRVPAQAAVVGDGADDRGEGKSPSANTPPLPKGGLGPGAFTSSTPGGRSDDVKNNKVQISDPAEKGLAIP